MPENVSFNPRPRRLLLLLCLLSSPALADEMGHVSVAVTTTASAAQAVPLNRRLIFYCSTATVRVLWCKTSTCVATAAYPSFPLPAAHFETWSSSLRGYFSLIATTGTATCEIFRVET